VAIFSISGGSSGRLCRASWSDPRYFESPASASSRTAGHFLDSAGLGTPPLGFLWGGRRYFESPVSACSRSRASSKVLTSKGRYYYPPSRVLVRCAADRGWRPRLRRRRRNSPDSPDSGRQESASGSRTCGRAFRPMTRAIFVDLATAGGASSRRFGRKEREVIGPGMGPAMALQQKSAASTGS
jgi:hypothetical protein